MPDELTDLTATPIAASMDVMMESPWFADLVNSTGAAAALPTGVRQALQVATSTAAEESGRRHFAERERVKRLANAPFEPVTAISSSMCATFALSSAGKVFAWKTAECGFAWLGDTSKPAELDTEALGPAIAVSAERSSLAVIAQNGGVWRTCFCADKRCTLDFEEHHGDRSRWLGHKPTGVDARALIQVTAVEQFTAGIDDEGRVVVWDGRLYVRDGLRGALPLQLEIRAVALAADGAELLILDQEGAVWSWPRRSDVGQGGIGGPTTIVSPNLSDHTIDWDDEDAERPDGAFEWYLGDSPQGIPDLRSRIVAIAAWNGIGVALDSNGQFWSWATRPKLQYRELSDFRPEQAGEVHMRPGSTPRAIALCRNERFVLDDSGIIWWACGRQSEPLNFPDGTGPIIQCVSGSQGIACLDHAGRVWSVAFVDGRKPSIQVDRIALGPV